jgi:hypothetical protein
VKKVVAAVAAGTLALAPVAAPASAASPTRYLAVYDWCQSTGFTPSFLTYTDRARGFAQTRKDYKSLNGSGSLRKVTFVSLRDGDVTSVTTLASHC